MVLRTFGWSFGVTVVALTGALILGGPTALALVAILSILEISLSFDNAVVNATILERMNEFWRKMFLSVGIIIAVFGMRLVFPLLIVAITAGLGPVEAVQLALDGGGVDEPGTYANLLHDAHPSIAAFGGMFLLILFLDFIFEDRAIRWLTWLETPLARIGKLDQLSVVVAVVALVIAAEVFAEDTGTVMVSGAIGLVAYLAVNGLGELFESQGLAGDEAEGREAPEDEAGLHGDAVAVDTYHSGSATAPKAQQATGTPAVTLAAGKAAFFLFLYLEVLDASFSFDGVIGAFAITQDIFVIATGLGVGAMYIRSLTVFLVKAGTLSEYVYLEHGAHWAIGALATILLVSIEYEVPEVVTGLIGVGFIAAAFISSIIRNRSGGPDAAAQARREALAHRS